MSLTRAEQSQLRQLLRREPNALEWAVFAAMWSEHCSYKSTKHLLRQLPATGPGVRVGVGENAGVVDVGDGLSVAFKMESHNHPSAIEPRHGAATGVGGILRDIVAMGARPIALLDSLRFGDVSHPLTRQRLRGVVDGIAMYGNAIGVPVVGGETVFDAAFNDNPLVNVLAVGVVGSARVVRGRADGVGNTFVYLGAATGRDGLRGAEMASTALRSVTKADRPAVQIGDPFGGKCLLECCLAAYRTGAVVGAQDLGAAGLASAAIELAARASTGVSLRLDAVPTREAAMTPIELLLSETQERMLLVVQAGRTPEIAALAKRWGLACAVVGEVTDTGRFELTSGDDLIASLPLDALVGGAPPADAVMPSPVPVRTVEALPLGHPNSAGKAWIYEQFDHTVRAGTIRGPGAAAASVVRLPNSAKALAITLASDPSPARSVAIAARALACVGAVPLAVTDNLNFGDPTDSRVASALARALGELADACRLHELPVVSGNISLHNAAGGVSIPGVPVIGMIGLVADAATTCGLAFAPGNILVALRADDDRELNACIRGLVTARVVASTALLTGGDLPLRLARGCLAGRVGATVRVADAADGVLASCAPDQLDAVLLACATHGIRVTELGRTGGDLLVTPQLTHTLAELERLFSEPLPRLAGDLGIERPR